MIGDKNTDSQARAIKYLDDHEFPLMKILSGEIRYSILRLLRVRNMGYNEIRDDLRLDRKSRNYAFHVRILIQFHLISKSKRNGLYNITVKGLRTLRGPEMINGAEMFL